MAVLLPKNAAVRQLADGEIVQMGLLTFPNAQELAYAQALIYVHNYSITTERLRIHCYTDSMAGGQPVLAFSSDWVSLSLLGLAASAKWWGWVRFPFGRQTVATTGTHSETYRFYIEASGPTISSQSWLGCAVDTVAPTSTVTGTPLALRLYGYR